MKSYSGPFFMEEGFIQAQIDVEGNKVIEFEEGGDKGEDVIIIPTPVNAHTHSGDSFIKSTPEGTIEEVVGPEGIKHRALEKADPDVVIESMQSYFKEMMKNGVRKVIEFREGGVEGIKILKEAVKRLDQNIDIKTFSRPSRRAYDEWELNQLISLSDGIGLSAYRDWDRDQILKIAETASRMKTPFALHCSEDVREPLGEIIDMNIHHLVHMIEATEDDLLTCSIENIPIVICPRSNMQFGKLPDIPSMLENDVVLSLGTDNAMLAGPDMFKEMEFAYRISRLKGGITAEDILTMATWNPRESLYPSLDVADSDTEEDTYIVLDRKGYEPAFEVVTRSSLRDIKKIVVW